ncbi:MAG: glycosyltransferase [Mycobacterium sp.]|uniref:glycosyltransferase n=1 Tax=Mycobacterium sp. TaxID=1785 RepID=UPI003F94E61A
MKFVVAGYGSRGDVEPCAAAALELLRRGHDVRMAVPPNMLGFIESAGLAGVAYGPDSREEMNPASDLVGNLLPKMKNPLSVVPEVVEHVTQVKVEKGATLTALANGADLVLAGFNEQGLAANVAEYYGIPAVALHLFPERIWSSGWLFSLMTKVAEDAQRRELGLPEGTGPSPLSLEIQAYDELCLPGLAAEWADQAGRRPFVGALTLELPTAADDEVLSWIAAGTPAIYFGLGSTPIASPADTIAMISAACAQLGERALICSGPNDVTGNQHPDHVKVVDAVNHSAIFPACRAVVHHGGAGTTAAGLRAGIPTLILFAVWLDQPIWAAAVEQLEVGFGRHFSETTVDTLVADLRSVLAPRFVAQAREIATHMTKPAESLANAGNLLEDTARRGRMVRFRR